MPLARSAQGCADLADFATVTGAESMATSESPLILPGQYGPHPPVVSPQAIDIHGNHVA